MIIVKFNVYLQQNSVKNETEQDKRCLSKYVVELLIINII